MSYRVALVTVMFMDIDVKDTLADSSAQASTTNWIIEDMTCADTLITQLRGLLGDPFRESMQPEVPVETIAGFVWPGQVNVDREDA